MPRRGSKHRAQLRVPQEAGANRKYSGTSSQAATTLPQLAFRAAVSMDITRFEVYESYLDEEYTNNRAKRLMIKN
jgi:hypothetical protein